MSTSKLNLDVTKGFSHCFGCGQENPIGLRLKVDWDGKIASTEFTPGPDHTGFSDMVHGGVLCALMDEVMSYVPFHQGILTVTGKMEVRFRRPAQPGNRLVISASMTRTRGKLLETACTVTERGGAPVAEGKATMWIIENNGKLLEGA